jgi:hypothetical protein
VWRPRSEAEIQAAIDNGITRETASFDAKAALPRAGRNKDLAKDICAMTVDGGVLLYGLAGDDPTRPDQRQPFDLANTAERIDQVAQTAIAEPPVIEIHDIPSEDQPGKGYLCVVVPASPRAPHMLTIDGDNRYWGRGPTGNRLLSEGEVARLYERRERWERDRDQLLDEVVRSMPFGFEVEDNGLIVTAVRPVLPGRELLRIAAGDRVVDDFVQTELTPVAQRADIYPQQGTAGLGDALRVWRAGAQQWVFEFERDLSSRYQARGELTADGSLNYWHSPIFWGDEGGRQVIMERSVTRAVYQPLATASWLYERAGFQGGTDVAVALLGIENAVGGTLFREFHPPTYGAPDYRAHARVTSEELRSDLGGLVRRLLDPLFEVISVRGYDPLADNR